MCVFSPRREPEKDHALNCWLSLGCIVLAVAAAITWRACHNPSLDAMRISRFTVQQMACIAGQQPQPQEGMRQ